MRFPEARVAGEPGSGTCRGSQRPGEHRAATYDHGTDDYTADHHTDDHRTAGHHAAAFRHRPGHGCSSPQRAGPQGAHSQVAPNHRAERRRGLVLSDRLIRPSERSTADPVLVWLAALGVAAVAVWLALSGFELLAAEGVLANAVGHAQVQTVGPALLGVVAVTFAAERLWPAEARPARTRAHLVDAWYLVLYAAAVPAVTALDTGFALVVERRAGFFILGRLPLVPQAAAVVLVLALIDAANWAAHAANHRSAVLWRFHALHHSQEQMSVLTTFRTHPLTHVAYLPALLPALALGASGPLPAAALVAYGCLVALSHANVGWTYGPLGRVLVSPAFHRIHHTDGSVGVRRGANFGFVLTVWDHLARTAVTTGEARPSGTGIAGRPVPVEQHPEASAVWRVVVAQLVQPFRLRSGLEG